MGITEGASVRSMTFKETTFKHLHHYLGSESNSPTINQRENFMKSPLHL